MHRKFSLRRTSVLVDGCACDSVRPSLSPRVEVPMTMTTPLDPRPSPAQVHACLATDLSDSAFHALLAVLTSDPNWRLRAIPGPTTWNGCLRYSPHGRSVHVHLVRRTPLPPPHGQPLASCPPAPASPPPCPTATARARLPLTADSPPATADARRRASGACARRRGPVLQRRRHGEMARPAGATSPMDVSSPHSLLPPLPPLPPSQARATRRRPPYGEFCIMRTRPTRRYPLSPHPRRWSSTTPAPRGAPDVCRSEEGVARYYASPRNKRRRCQINWR